MALCLSFIFSGCVFEDKDEKDEVLSEEEIAQLLEEFGEQPSNNASENRDRVDVIILHPVNQGGPGVTRSESVNYR